MYVKYILTNIFRTYKENIRSIFYVYLFYVWIRYAVSKSVNSMRDDRIPDIYRSSLPLANSPFASMIYTVAGVCKRRSYRHPERLPRRVVLTRIGRTTCIRLFYMLLCYPASNLCSLYSKHESSFILLISFLP